MIQVFPGYFGNVHTTQLLNCKLHSVDSGLAASECQMSPTAYQDLPSYTRAYHFKPSRFLSASLFLFTFDICDVMARLLLFVMVLALPTNNKF